MRFLILIFSAAYSAAGLAQEAAEKTTPAPSDLHYIVFGLAVIAILAATLLIKYTEYSWTPYSVIRLIGLILILVITLFLTVVPGIEQDTLTQVIGLLGAIGGYLLGKDPREKDINHRQAPQPQSDDDHADSPEEKPLSSKTSAISPNKRS